MDIKNGTTISKDSDASITTLFRPPDISNIAWCWYLADMNHLSRIPSPYCGRAFLLEEIGQSEHVSDAELTEFRFKYAHDESNLPTKELDYLKF